MHDILIRGGILFDGAGHSGIADDLAIEGGRIAENTLGAAARPSITDTKVDGRRGRDGPLPEVAASLD
jgi:N-acyl-D-aspartate/D-glutamate deacylase